MPPGSPERLPEMRRRALLLGGLALGGAALAPPALATPGRPPVATVDVGAGLREALALAGDAAELAGVISDDRHGPFEWVWKSLTYKERQPLRRA